MLWGWGSKRSNSAYYCMCVRQKERELSVSVLVTSILSIPFPAISHALSNRTVSSHDKSTGYPTILQRHNRMGSNDVALKSCSNCPDSLTREGWINLSARGSKNGPTGMRVTFYLLPLLGFGLPGEKRNWYFTCPTQSRDWKPMVVLVAPCSSLPLHIPYSHYCALAPASSWVAFVIDVIDCWGFARLIIPHHGDCPKQIWRLGHITHVTLTMEFARYFSEAPRGGKLQLKFNHRVFLVCVCC